MAGEIVSKVSITEPRLRAFDVAEDRFTLPEFNAALSVVADPESKEVCAEYTKLVDRFGNEIVMSRSRLSLYSDTIFIETTDFTHCKGEKHLYWAYADGEVDEFLFEGDTQNLRRLHEADSEDLACSIWDARPSK